MEVGEWFLLLLMLNLRSVCPHSFSAAFLYFSFVE